MVSAVALEPKLPQVAGQNRNLAAESSTERAKLQALLDEIKDPEIPVLSIAELGILRDFHSSGKGARVVITPTYCGCPAMEHIKADIHNILGAAGYDPVSVETRLAPAWSTDWITRQGRRKLLDFGIAPPHLLCGRPIQELSAAGIACPRCGTLDTRCISAFGSTACKSLYRCLQCGEPFDYFKCI